MSEIVSSVIHSQLELVEMLLFRYLHFACARMKGVISCELALAVPAAGRSNPVDPVLPWFPQDPEPAHIP